jgi:hypothetical protein
MGGTVSGTVSRGQNIPKQGRFGLGEYRMLCHKSFENKHLGISVASAQTPFNP